MLGGFSDNNDPQVRNEAQTLLEKHKDDLLGKGVTGWNGVELVNVQTQVVAGTNFKITFKADGKDWTTTIYRPLPPNHVNTEVSDLA